MPQEATSSPMLKGLSESTLAALAALPEETKKELEAQANTLTPRSFGEVAAASVEPPKPPKAPAVAAKTAEEIFKMIDADNSGSVTAAELETKLKESGPEIEALLGVETINALVAKWSVGDKDNDGKITWPEFQRLCGRARAKKIYESADKDNTGEVSYEELMDKLESDTELEALLGIKVVCKLLSDLWDDEDSTGDKIALDKDKDGNVSFEEFWDLIGTNE